MVTAIIEGIKHYYVNRDWFFDAQVCEKGMESIVTPAWKRGPIDKNAGECHQYEKLILDAYQLQERLEKARKEYDCSELSNAIRKLKESVQWMQEALLKYSTPSTEIHQE